jgi:hypothetical protein
MTTILVVEIIIGIAVLAGAVLFGIWVSADFHATGSGQGGSGEFVAQGAVSPPGDGGVVGEVGLAEHG